MDLLPELLEILPAVAVVSLTGSGILPKEADLFPKASVVFVLLLLVLLQLWVCF